MEVVKPTEQEANLMEVLSGIEVIKIAMVCHEANKMWCEGNNDFSQKTWNEAEDWQKKTVINGVKFKFDNPESTADNSHTNWMNEKIKDGWKYGEVKDVEKKTHPNLVPFNDLPIVEQQKDALFCAIVDALKP